MKFKKPKAKRTLEDFFKLNFDENHLWEYKADEIDLLVELVSFLRPKNKGKAKEVDINKLLYVLKENEGYRQGLALYLKQVLQNKKFSKILTDAGILTTGDFFHEVRTRLFAKLIPDQPEKDSLEYVLNQVFFDKNDPRWIEKIPYGQIDELYDLLEFRSIYTSAEPHTPLA